MIGAINHIKASCYSSVFPVYKTFVTSFLSGRQDDEEEEIQHSEEPPPQLPQEQPETGERDETAQGDDVYQSDEDSDSSPDVQEADGSGDEKVINSPSPLLPFYLSFSHSPIEI